MSFLGTSQYYVIILEACVALDTENCWDTYYSQEQTSEFGYL